jgi:hypothetical protein
VGRLKGVGKVYLHAVVDTYGSTAFGFLHTSKQPEAATQRRPALLPRARPAHHRGADRQWPRVLRDRQPSLRSLPGSQ